MSTSTTTTAIAPRRQSAAIVAAGFGQNAVLTLVTTFLLVYLIEYAGVTAQGLAVVTAIITATKLFDAFADPVMGSLIDLTRTRWGKFRPFILFSAVPVAVLTALLFSVPDTSEPIKLLFFGVVYFLWGIAYTMCDVPYWGLIGSAFVQPRQRAGVIANVRAFGAISLGIVTLGMPWIARWLSFSDGTTAAGWSAAAILVAAVGMALYLLAFFATRERTQARSAERMTLRVMFGTLARNTPLLMVLLGSVLGFGRLIVQAGGAVFVVIAYGDEGRFTLIGAAIIVGMVLASFLTPLLLRVLAGRTLMVWSTVAASVFYVGMWLAGFGNLIAFLTLIFLTGLTLGVFVVVQTTMIADAVDDVERRTGVRNDGLSFSTLTFVSKIMNALAVLVFGLILVISGYGADVTVTSDMQALVWASITLVPAVSCLISILPFLLYRLGGAARPQDLVHGSDAA